MLGFFHRGKSGRVIRHDTTLTYSCRGAIYHVLNELPYDIRREVLVPAFHCPTVVDPVVFSGYTPRFYGITPELSIDFSDLEKKVTDNTRAIIIVNFFGFPADIEPIRSLCENRSILIIEDCAHSFLNTAPLGLAGCRGDISVYSFKKLVPCQTGGGISLNHDSTSTPRNLPTVPVSESLKILKYLFSEVLDSCASKSNIVKKILTIRQKLKSARQSTQSTSAERITEFEYPFVERLESSRIPWFAKRLLLAHNFQNIADKRRQNYLVVLDMLKGNKLLTPVFRELPDSVVPWALPVTISNRSKFDIQLRKLGIPVFTFGETLHKLIPASDSKQAETETSINTAWKLSKTLLCIPIHQNLENNEVKHWRHAFTQLTQEI